MNTREPSTRELSNYLKEQLTGLYGWERPAWEANTEFTSEEVSGDGKPDLVRRDEYDGSLAYAIVYTDVSGDKESDIVAYGYNGLVILVWDSDHYTQPFWIPPDLSRGELKNEVTFQDWTHDGTPEVVHDSSFSSGGTGLNVYLTVRSIVYCQVTGCETVWKGTISHNTDEYNTGGLGRFQINIRPSLDTKGQPIIRAIEEGFSLYCCCCVSGSELERVKGLDVITSTLSIYTWQGQTFELTDQQIVSFALHIDSLAVLGTINVTGAAARITAKDNYAAGNRNDYCQLKIEGKAVGKDFGCRESFTSVAWKDITSDGIKEVVVIAFSAGYPLNDQGNSLGEERCMHQHLLAYQWDGANATEIANVTGCVIRKDLYGVRLEDFDQDGQLEILAAANGTLNNRAYKWNGKKFVLWSDLP